MRKKKKRNNIESINNEYCYFFHFFDDSSSSYIHKSITSISLKIVFKDKIFIFRQRLCVADLQTHIRTAFIDIIIKTVIAVYFLGDEKQKLDELDVFISCKTITRCKRWNAVSRRELFTTMIKTFDNECEGILGRV